MTTSALTMMIAVWIVVIFFTAYFFIKVLKTPKRSEPDSYSENDDKLKTQK